MGGSVRLGGNAAWVGLSLLVLGCASYSPHLGARTLAPAASESSLTLDALLVDRGFGPQWFVAPDLSVRSGVSDDWDVGGRVYPLGVELSARRRLLGAPRFSLALAPLLAGGQVSATNADTSFVELTSGAALLGSLDFGQGELVMGLRSQLRLGLNSVALHEDFSAARWGSLWGASLALSVPHDACARWFPGVVLLIPYDHDRALWDAPILQGGAALVW